VNAKQIGRNDPCSCGSGQKYKRCCATKDAAARSQELLAQAEARAAVVAAEAAAAEASEAEGEAKAAPARPKRPKLPTTYGSNRSRGV